ncbi:MAG TPA: 16S rRNA (guanine(966)-N(2))-methyltransferase RsmD [Castellaniella sp.]|uniref:16S rRNA (guanine(966)-N(2))-methyltransferase RsmD n=1 Tax=Castellaniella sp. TaxID=1955812 RepID=UPI002F0AF41B
MKKHQIRIVGGHYRRTVIPVPEGDHLRPTPDRVRETLFNWLTHFWGADFQDRQVLDLFAGTGALGFEAASRGAGRVQLVERAPAALSALRALQSRLQAPAVDVHAGDALAYLQAQARATYDLILLDPPFGDPWMARLWPLLPRALQHGGLLYLEADASAAAPEGWQLLRQGRAGQVHYHLFLFAAAQENMNNGLMHNRETA